MRVDTRARVFEELNVHAGTRWRVCYVLQPSVWLWPLHLLTLLFAFALTVVLLRPSGVSAHIL